jgi:ATP-dependent DNA helicase RecG
MLSNIELLIQTGEGYHLEFKENVDKSIVKEVCAFANADGGTILIGITDARQLKPLNIDNRLLSQVQDTINQIEPKIQVNINPINGILVIEVPRGSSKPYACSDGFFMRSGANSQKLTRNEIMNMFQREGVVTFDSLENNKAKFETDFDLAAYKQFLLKARMSSLLEPKQVLKNLGCMTEDEKFTNGGVLFFTKSIEFLIRQAVCTCVLYKGINKLKILDRKDYSGNMLDNIDNVVNFVKRHTNLEYVIEHIQREDIPEIPEIALREAIVNAFAHRYYFEQGSNILVEVFDDRVSITSFGGLPAGLNKKDFGKKSVQRNPLIADLLVRANYIEKVGTGVQRIKDAVTALGKGTVDFQYDEHWFDVIFSRQVKQMSVEMSVEMSEQILSFIRTNPKVTIVKLAQILNVTPRTIERAIANLKSHSKLERIGSTKSGYWQVK